MKEAVTFMRPPDGHVRRQLSTNGTFGGNELAQIFNEIAKSEVCIFYRRSMVGANRQEFNHSIIFIILNSTGLNIFP